MSGARWWLACVLLACGPTPTPTPTSTSTPTPTPTSTSTSTPTSTPTPTPTATPTPSPTPTPTPTSTPTSPFSIPRSLVSPTLDGVLDDAAWSLSAPLAITTDWSGGSVSTPETLVRLAWSDTALFVAFECSFEPPLTAPEAPVTPEHEHLYGYDVVEIFVDADATTPRTYREIELGPRGHTLDVAVDLDARPHGDVSWSSGVLHAERVDDATHRFVVEASIPVGALERTTLAAGDALRIGLFRITGHSPAPRLFLARFPTETPRPNFHVPERFGTFTLAGP